MEVAAHLLYTLLSSPTIFLRSAFTNLKFLIYFLTCLYIFIFRLAGPDADINVYLEAATYDYNPIYYYLREPVVWFGLIFVNNIIGDPQTSLFIFDLLLISCLYFTVHQKRYGVSLFIIWCSSFIFLLGLQNVYRQYASLTFILCGLTLLNDRKNTVASLYFCLAILSHNAAVFLLPIFASRIIGAHQWFTLFLASSLLGALVLHMNTEKSFSSTGSDARSIYVLVIIILSSVDLLLKKVSTKFWEYFALYLLVAFLYTILGPAQFERAMMYYLTLIIFNLVSCNFYYQFNHVTVRSLLFLIFTPSIYLFSARHILIG